MAEDKKDGAPQEAPPSVDTDAEAIEPNRKPKTILRPPVDRMARPGMFRGYQTK
jgi:hypothetical protein